MSSPLRCSVGPRPAPRANTSPATRVIVMSRPVGAGRHLPWPRAAPGARRSAPAGAGRTRRRGTRARPHGGHRRNQPRAGKVLDLPQPLDHVEQLLRPGHRDLPHRHARSLHSPGLASSYRPGCCSDGQLNVGDAVAEGLAPRCRGSSIRLAARSRHAIDTLISRLAAPRCRIKTPVTAETEAQIAIDEVDATRWIRLPVEQDTVKSFWQAWLGPPAPEPSTGRRPAPRCGSGPCCMTHPAT